jgi:muconolactone delta-isomerase
MALFAVIAKRAPIGIGIDEFQQRLAEGFQYTQQLQEKGAIKHRWVLVGASAGLNIYEVDSHAELMSLLYNSPAGLHLDYTVYPIIEPPSYDPTAYAAAGEDE